MVYSSQNCPISLVDSAAGQMICDCALSMMVFAVDAAEVTACPMKMSVGGDMMVTGYVTLFSTFVLL